jgi:carbonic anhydrase/acetyltransferase-like protein (isoleucine patch superfamily)
MANRPKYKINKKDIREILYRDSDDYDHARKILVYRITALRSFRIASEPDAPSIETGDSGGWIQCEDNLSQSDNCWVMGDSVIYGNARVQDDAIIWGGSRIYENARIIGRATIDDSQVYGHAVVGASTSIEEKSCIKDFAVIEARSGSIRCSNIWDYAHVDAEFIYTFHSVIGGRAHIRNGANIIRSDIDGNALVDGLDVSLEGANIGGNGWIRKVSDYFVAGPFLEHNLMHTFYHAVNRKSVGNNQCFDVSHYLEVKHAGNRLFQSPPYYERDDSSGGEQRKRFTHFVRLMEMFIKNDPDNRKYSLAARRVNSNAADEMENVCLHRVGR